MRISLRSKLTLILAVPLLVLIVAGVRGVQRASQTTDRAAITADRIELSLAATTAALELAQERALSAGASDSDLDVERALLAQRDRAVNGFVGLCLLALPIVGMVYVASRLASRLMVAGQAWWRARPSTTALVTAVAGVALAWNIGFVWPDAFASALLQAQQATSPVGEVAVPDSETAGSASASGGDLIGSQMSVSSTTAQHRPGPSSTKPPITVTTLPPSTDPTTSATQVPRTTAGADDEPRQGGGIRATPGTTSAPSTDPAPTTTTDRDLLSDLIAALFPKP